MVRRVRRGCGCQRVDDDARSTGCAFFGVACVGYPQLRSPENVNCPCDRCGEAPSRRHDSWIVTLATAGTATSSITEQLGCRDNRSESRHWRGCGQLGGHGSIVTGD